jgi:Flp pilus assembly pilin Flp
VSAHVGQLEVPTRRRIGRPTLAHPSKRTEPEGKEVITTMTALIRLLSSADRSDERGQGLAEYALILTFIAVVLVVALAFFGGQINTMLSNVGSSI